MPRMETPPAYAPPKKSNTGLIIGLVLGGIAICCIGGVALLGFGGLKLFQGAAPMVECMMNYSVIEKAMNEYSAKNNGKLPAAANWQTELTPFVESAMAAVKKEAGPFKPMNPTGEWGCADGGTKTGMAFNLDASGKTMDEVRSKDLVTIFEVSQTGRNIALKYEEQPRSTSPKIFGNPRGWIKIKGGELEMDDKNTNMDFNSNP